MPSPSERLRRAAALLRQRAEAATPGPWISLDNGDRIIRDPDATAREDDSNPCGAGPPLEYVVDEPLYAHPENGDYIALMHPGVALLLADLLESVAEDWAALEAHNAAALRLNDDEMGEDPYMHDALALADALTTTTEDR